MLLRPLQHFSNTFDILPLSLAEDGIVGSGVVHRGRTQCEVDRDINVQNSDMCLTDKKMIITS